MTDIMAVDPSLLTHFRLYRGLEPNTLAELARIAILKRLRKGQRLWRQGDAPEGYFSALSGLVKSYRETPDGREQILCLLGPGQQIGTMSVLSDSSFPCHASVLEGGEFLYFPKAAFKEVVRQHHDLALQLLANLATQCNVLADRIEDLSLHHAEQRVGGYLLTLPVKESGPNEHPMVRLPISKTTLATMLGLSRETLSRTFAALQHRGLIVIDGRQIELADCPALELLADGQAAESFVH
ncbi:MAG: CRP-like cAMP-activated global transcriptional regulator [bacterium]|nr:CRP-like cAMP-activated global transcriptional regulator [bacterium]